MPAQKNVSITDKPPARACAMANEQKGPPVSTHYEVTNDANASFLDNVMVRRLDGCVSACMVKAQPDGLQCLLDRHDCGTTEAKLHAHDTYNCLSHCALGASLRLKSAWSSAGEPARKASPQSSLPHKSNLTTGSGGANTAPVHATAISRVGGQLPYTRFNDIVATEMALRHAAVDLPRAMIDDTAPYPMETELSLPSPI